MAEQLRRERLRREMIDEIIGTARLLLEKGGPSAISVLANCAPWLNPLAITPAVWPWGSAAGLHGLTGPRE